MSLEFHKSFAELGLLPVLQTRRKRRKRKVKMNCHKTSRWQPAASPRAGPRSPRATCEAGTD